MKWVNKVLQNGNDINEIFNIIYETHSEIFDSHAPLTEVI